MDDITIEDTEEAAPESKDGKKVLFLIVVVVAIFAIALGTFSSLRGENTITRDVSVDELHKLNYEGELSAEEGYIYNEYSFVKDDGLWWTIVAKRDVLIKLPLHFGPREVDFIKIKGVLDSRFNRGEQVHIAIDPTVADKFYTLAASELSNNVGKGINRIPIGSCTVDNEICVDRDIVSCENTQGKPVIELALADKPRIDFIGTCIKIQGQDYNLVRAVDRLLYHWYEVIES